MIKRLLIFLMLLFPFNLMAQNDDMVYDRTNVDVCAHFIGNGKIWVLDCRKYIDENLIYPQKGIDEQIEGDVKINFIVEKDGTLTNFTVEQSICDDFDAEAIRIFHQMPKWKPGLLNGEPIRQRISFTVTFKLKK